MLFRESDAPNAKLWVDAARLGTVWSSRFDQFGHVRAAEERIRVAAEMADRVIEDLLDAKRELSRKPAAPRNAKVDANLDKSEREIAPHARTRARAHGDP